LLIGEGEVLTGPMGWVGGGGREDWLGKKKTLLEVRGDQLNRSQEGEGDGIPV